MSDVYGPEVIPDVPFPLPQNGDVSSLASAPVSGDIIHPATIQPQPFPNKIVSQETIGSALNTRSKKILADFQFMKNGAIEIGDYQPGISGDIKISPNGIIARDLSGNPTFTLDGDTGDATFKGTVEAGDFVIADKLGLVSLANFSSTNVEANNLNQTITSQETTWTDITGAIFSFTLARDAIVLINTKVSLWTVMNDGVDVDPLIGINLDGVVPGGSLRTHRIWYRNLTDFNTVTSSMHRLEILAAGDHIIKLQATLNRASGSPSLNIYNYYFSYLILGR